MCWEEDVVVRLEHLVDPTRDVEEVSEVEILFGKVLFSLDKEDLETTEVSDDTRELLL